MRSIKYRTYTDTQFAIQHSKLLYFFLILFIHERHTERSRDTGRRRKRVPVGSPMWNWIPGPWDHDLSQMQMVNHRAIQVPSKLLYIKISSCYIFLCPLFQGAGCLFSVSPAVSIWGSCETSQGSDWVCKSLCCWRVRGQLWQVPCEYIQFGGLFLLLISDPDYFKGKKNPT